MNRLLLLLALLLAAAPASAQPAGLGGPDTTAVPAPDPVPVDAVADSLVEARLRATFANIDQFADIGVEVDAGVVRLTGSTLTGEARQQAEDLARRFEGVLFVDNEIEEATDVEERVTPALQKVRTLVQDAFDQLPVFAIALIIVLLFWALGSLLGRWEQVYDWFGVNPLLRELIRQVLRLVIVLTGLVLALEVLDATALVGAVLGTAGVAGLAIGFAFRDIVENYLAGALLSLRRPFAVGDHVLIDAEEGKIIRLTSRELVLMTLDGNHVRIPNATVFKSILTNYTRNPRRRFQFVVGVGVEEDLVEAQRLGVETLRDMEGVLTTPAPFAFVEALGDSNVSVRFFGWVDQREADFAKVQSEAIRMVKVTLDDAGVTMPEPIYKVRLQQGTSPGAEPAPKAARPTEQADVAPDDDLDRQIREDLADPDEPNYLT